jgi:thioredoxin 1
MNHLKHFDGPTFEADVLQSDLPVLVDFWAEWCPPCKMMEPVVERLADELAGKITVGKLDVDDNQEIAIRYGVMGIPTLGLFRGGKLIDRMVGFPGSSAPIKAWLQKSVPVGAA